MTAIVGILNKRGAAIAADSAVTRTRNRQNKCTKNGNKMVRMSNAVPISIMLTGNGDFLCTQWDIIVRHYRQHRGDIAHSTVEACAHDFFQYISDHHLFCEKEIIDQHIWYNMEDLFKNADDDVEVKLRGRDERGMLTSPKAYLKEFLKILSIYRKGWTKYAVSPHFADYGIEQFREYAGRLVDKFLSEKCYEEDDLYFGGKFPEEIIDSIHDDFELTLMTMLINRSVDAEVVFTGYGTDQKYPSLVSVAVFEGFDNRVNYHIRPEDIVCISEERPVAICPFAQHDVIDSLLRGIHPKYHKYVCRPLSSFSNIFGLDEDKEISDFDYLDFLKMLNEVDSQGLDRRFEKACESHRNRNWAAWEKALENYDLLAMAALAQSLIDLTGFHRILHFEQEGVGGPVDLAVITKAEGFTWLSRKSWYHHKDIGGQYGVLGV